jgi:hypothetical protein
VILGTFECALLIEFDIQDARGKNSVVSIYVLYGSADIDRSLHRLEPGHQYPGVI